jgi:CubicO group peptidase (beta-lactamase class C family)
MVKPITCVATMMLFEEGAFLLDDPVSRYIPEFKNFKVMPGTDEAEIVDLECEITIRDLLTNTAGLSYGILQDSPVDKMYQDANLFGPVGRQLVPLQELVEIVTNFPLVFQPGQNWRYSVSHDVIAHLVSLLSNTPFDMFLQDRIFEPLAMEDTAFYVPKEKINRFAPCYYLDDKGDFIASDVPLASPYTNPNSNPSGGAVLLSTTLDYLHFCQMLLNNGELNGIRLLSPKTIKLMTRNHLPSDLVPIQISPEWIWHGYGYGLGFGVLINETRFEGLGSEGTIEWGGGNMTRFWIDPKEEVIGLLMGHTIRSFDLNQSTKV